MKNGFRKGPFGRPVPVIQCYSFSKIPRYVNSFNDLKRAPPIFAKHRDLSVPLESHALDLAGQGLDPGLEDGVGSLAVWPGIVHGYVRNDALELEGLGMPAEREGGKHEDQVFPDLLVPKISITWSLVRNLSVLISRGIIFGSFVSFHSWMTRLIFSTIIYYTK